MSGSLWRDHVATPRQQQLGFRAAAANREQNSGARQRRTRRTQADVLLAMLRDARSHGNALDLPEIMRAGIAQHGARLSEIRERGFVVENEITRNGDMMRSRYWLRHDPERDGRHAE